jgi:hypothetical protein
LRKQTPPDVKWLLVERATLAGDVARLEKTAQRVMIELEKKKAAMSALDVTIRIINERLKPGAAGVIRAFHPGYGKRGALSDAIKTVIRGSPEGVTTEQLANLIASEFQIRFLSRADAKQFMANCIRRTVSKLRADGFVRTFPDASGRGRFHLHRWNEQSVTLADLKCHAERGCTAE